MKKIIRTIPYLILILFSTFVVVDTFWIPKTGAKAISKSKITDSNETAKQYAKAFDVAADSKGTVTATATTYADKHIQITTKTVRTNNTDVHLADIKVDNPYFWRSAFATGQYGRNLIATTSQMAKANNAILAINGDFYGFRDTGFVIRNGVLYRDVPGVDNGAGNDALVIDAKGNMYSADQATTSAQSLLTTGAQQVLSFGPTLIKDKKILIQSNYEVKEADVSNPRTAIGQIGENHYLIAVSDGRTSQNAGLTLYQLSSVMKEAGAKYAYNLDGGGSSAMVLNNTVVNVPIAGLTGSNTAGVQRAVSDILYIGYKQ